MRPLTRSHMPTLILPRSSVASRSGMLRRMKSEPS